MSSLPEAPKPHPTGWIETTLGSAFRWSSGGTPLTSKGSYYGGEIPWVTISDLGDGPISDTKSKITPEGLANSSAKWVEPGSVLVAIYGSIGKLGIAKIQLTTNQAIAFTDPSPHLPEYVFWWLMSRRAYLNSLGQGGTQRNISQTILRSVPIRIAPLPEQRRIVEAIETRFTRLDAAVGSLERVRANLKRYRASVLHAGCRGELLLTVNGNRAQPQFGDWPRQRIGDIVSLRNGAAFKPSDWSPSGVPIIRIQNLNDADAPFNRTTKKVNPKFRISTGDLLFAWSGTPGTSFGAHIWKGGEAWLNQHIFRIDFDQERISKRFLQIAINDNLNQYVSQAHGAAGLAHITKGKFESSEVSLPTRVHQVEMVADIDRRLSVADEVASDVAAGLKRCARLRESILKMAFEGRLVPQDPNDEPASVLLERIKKERASSNNPNPRQKERSLTA